MTACEANSKRRRGLSDDRGFLMVEILVSALMLVTVSLGAFLLLDNADKAAGNQQKRSLAANAAQSELERIRSLPVEDIAAARGTTTITRQGIKLTETIDAKWVTDGSDEPECTTRSGGLDYMRTTVTMSWTGMGSAKPVKLTSYYTPPAGAGGGDTGSASVHITDRNGGPVSGITVTLAGNQSFNEVTNVNGCVVFGFVPAGDYTVKFSRLGYVDGDSNPSVADPVRVTAGETNKLQYDYDQGGFTAAKFLVRVRGNTDGYAANVLRIGFFNAAQPNPPKMFDVDQTQPGGPVKWDGQSIPLFPFTSPYAVFAGNCQQNIPVSPNAQFVNISPNLFQNVGNLYMPGLDVTVRYGTPAAPGALVGNALVQYDPGCTPVYTRKTLPNPQNPTAGPTGQLLPGDTGFPYSTGGRICAAGPGNNGRRIVKNQANVNFGANGTQLTLYLNDTGSAPAGWTSASDTCFS